jgi:rhodanese-related sulfurtransferase
MKQMIKLSLLLIALLMAVSCLKEVKVEPKTFANADAMVADVLTRITEVNSEELKGIMDSTSFVLLDVRNENEHASGFIPGSVNIPRGSLEFRIDRRDVWEKEEMPIPDKGELIVVYCKAGNRSALAAETLQKLGYTQVKSLKGGWEEFHKLYHDLIDTKESAGGEKHAEEGGGC